VARRTYISALEEHPNLEEVLSVLAQLAHIGDVELPRLADAWVNNAAVAEARDKSLCPDSPLVLEALAAFEALTSLFEDDLAGEAAYVTVDPAVTTTALKAIRDAIAGAYAQPVLSKSEHALLMAPWRSVFPQSTVHEPDLGPEAARVKALLAALPRLAARCHDSESAELYERLLDRSFVDECDRATARDSAFQAAVVTSRRRVWALVRRSGTEGLSRSCATCPADPTAVDCGELSRVLTVCLDAACALLVADAVPEDLVELLTLPVLSLIPLQRDKPNT
jgi:hypothetical protein